VFPVDAAVVAGQDERVLVISPCGQRGLVAARPLSRGGVTCHVLLAQFAYKWGVFSDGDSDKFD
jgi:hypothetical protein